MANLARRLFSKVADKVSPQGCWIYTGGLSGDGYGIITDEGHNLQAHRVAWELLRGPIPEGLEIDHFKCYTRNCVNVHHMRVCTHLENARNRDRRKTASQYLGVTRDRKNNVWIAQLWVYTLKKRIKVYLGSFHKEIHASIAYQRALRILESCGA